MTLQEKKDLAIELETAYSTDAYNSNWLPCVKALSARGLTAKQIEAVIRSKWTRWAADMSEHPYGRAKSTDLIRFMEQNNYFGKDVEALTMETFGKPT